MRNTAARQHSPYTWDDYRTWGDEERWELVDGEAYAMAPAPSTRHQTILMELSAQLHAQFAGKRCRVLPAPTDVRLSDHDVVQPDISIVCNPKQIRPSHIEGAPRLVVEILSPTSTLHDRGRKLALYAGHGVREVWLVTPYPSVLEILVLSGGSYRLVSAYGRDETARSPTFRYLRLDLARVFDFPRESGEEPAIIREARPPYGRGAKVPVPRRRHAHTK